MRRLLLAGLLLLLPATALAQTQWGISIPAITNDLRLYEPTFTTYVGLHAPNSVTTYDCAMPGTIGTATQTLSISTVSPCALAWTSSGAGNVTHTGTLTANAFILGNGGADITALALTGLVLGNGASAPTAYAGTTPCSAGDFIRSLNGSGVATCATPAGGGNVNAGGTLTLHALVLGQGTTSVAVLGSLGTTTTVLHGNAAGDPSFAAVNLANDVTGTLAYASLPSQANNTILANVSGGSAVPAADTLTAIIDSAIGSTQGNILYRNATVWTVLAPGTSGQFLQTQGAGANVQWSAAGGGTVTGTGTTNLLAIWTSASAIGAFANGTGLLHSGTPPTWSLVNLSAGGDVVNVLTVPNGGLGLSSGTTGGIPYFTSGTSMASSAALTNHAVVIGGGSAQAPHTIATGTSGQFLQSQGASTDPAWVTGQVPGSPTTSVQFNNAGSFGGDANMTWDATNHRLGLGGVTPGYQVQANGAFYWSGTGPSVATFVTLQPNEMLAHLKYGGKTTGFLINQSTIARAMDADNDIGINIYKDETTGGTSSVGVGVSHLGLGTGDNFFAQTTTTATEWRDGLFRGDISGSAPASGGVGPGAVFMGNIFSTADPSSYILWAREHRSSVANAGSLRWEAEAITTGTAFALVHVSSAWVGDGIFLNFAAGSGSYSGNPIHVAVSSSNVFLLDGLGDLTIKGGFSTGNVGNPGSGGIRASNSIRSDVGFNVNGTAGVSATVTVGGGTAHGGADCTLIFTGGLYTGGTC